MGKLKFAAETKLIEIKIRLLSGLYSAGIITPMSIKFQIIKTYNNFEVLQHIEKRALEKYNEVGYDTSNWAIMTQEKLFEYFVNHKLWVAVNENKALGFAVAEVYGAYAHLEELDVDPVFQRQGIASSLISAIIDWAKKLNLSAITLRTFKTTIWSVELYKKLGFRINDENLNYISMIIMHEKSMDLPVSDRVTMILPII